MKRLDAFRFWGRRKAPAPREGGGDPIDAQAGADDRESAQQPGARRQLALGQAQLLRGAPAEALAAFESALELQHDLAAAHVGQAAACRELGRYEDAMDAVQLALAFDAASAAAHVELGRLQRIAGNAQAAILAFEAALGHGGEDATTLVELARVCNGRGDTAAAIAAYGRALDADPACHAALINLGLIHLHQSGDHAQAEAVFRRAVAAHPELPETHAHLGLALQAQGRFDAALALYAEQIARFPQFVELRWNRGIARLLQGEYAHGWEDYALRFERRGAIADRGFALPEWHPRQGCPGRLLVYAEQGIGDEIMFASCVPDLIAAGIPLLLECDPRLASLFRRAFAAIEVQGRPRSDDHAWLAQYPDVSCKVAIGTLPRHLRRKESEFPARAGYLFADQAARLQWHRRLHALGPGRKVGVSWRGGTPGTAGALRSIGIESLLPLMSVTGIEFICLQHDMREEERATLAQARLRMAEFPEIRGDFDQAAACIAALDSVITVGNSVAHLAGALGRPVRILLHRSPDWRWRWRGERSPWYPSATLFRQSDARDWDEPLAGVAAELTAEVAAGVTG